MYCEGRHRVRAGGEAAGVVVLFEDARGAYAANRRPDAVYDNFDLRRGVRQLGWTR